VPMVTVGVGVCVDPLNVNVPVTDTTAASIGAGRIGNVPSAVPL